jgi:hypothetical protein
MSANPAHAAADSIEGSGFPLAFRVREGDRRGALAGAAPGATTYRVEARTLGVHQKEALVAEGAGGAVWRLTSDEGPHLKGSDLAPFPLGFFNAGLQSDLLGRLLALARDRGIALSGAAIELTNRYAFDGSFFQGTGKGSAEPPEARFSLAGEGAPGEVARLLADAALASPLAAAVRTRLSNTFALYVNGKRRGVVGPHVSPAPDERDPLKAHEGVPRPLAGSDEWTPLIERRTGTEPSGPVARVSGASRSEIVVRGTGRIAAPGGLAFETWLERPAGTRFAFLADERPEVPDRAPTGLALAAAGIAFCYMTQLIRYIEYLEYKVRAVRLVQLNPFGLAGPPPAGTAGPVDTHLFLHGDEPDEVMQRLLAMGANTCYLHALLSASLELRLEATLNGTPLALPAR